MFDKIIRLSTIRNILINFFIAAVIYNIMLQITIPHIEAYLEGNHLFDLQPGGYSFENAVNLVAMLQPIKTYYLGVQLPLDFLYPLFMAVSGSLLLARLSKGSPYAVQVILLPILAGMFDYLENIGIILMLTRDLTQWLVFLSSAFSILKSLFTLLFITVIVILTLLSIIRRRGTIKHA